MISLFQPGISFFLVKLDKLVMIGRAPRDFKFFHDLECEEIPLKDK
ncbi:MAG: hypothetical protein ACTSRH_14435 [Promethearchaeota archaeon]